MLTLLRRTLAFSVSSLAAAQWPDDKPLGSCADVECPQVDNNTITAGCRISNQTYNAVGVDTFPFNSSDPDSKNLTWTTTFHDYTSYDPDVKGERTIEKAFFLGTADDLDLREAKGYGGCAVILEAYNTSSTDNSQTTRRTCEEVIGSECHKELKHDLVEFSKNQGTRTNSSSEGCEELENYLQSVSESDESECKMNWTQIHYFPLTGSSAPKPLSKEQNSTTNCWPTLPKTNDLAFVVSWNNTGTIWFNDTLPMVASVNLGLSVFWTEDGAETGVQDAESHVSCLWTVDETARSRETESSGEGDGDDDEGGVGRLEGAGWTVLGVALVTAWVLM